MPFKYACFISYCHGQYDLTKGFISQLKTALKGELEAYMDEQVYIDEERLKPGFLYNEELRSAICQSICMIVVYSPRYELHPYCGREFTAMEMLEEARRSLLEESRRQGVSVPSGPIPGFIIPVIFRGEGDLPERLTSRRHYVDFSRFSLAGTDISRHPEYGAKIREIAEVIYNHYKIFRAVGADACTTCDTFVLPSEAALPPWRPEPKPLNIAFPGRER